MTDLNKATSTALWHSPDLGYNEGLESESVKRNAANRSEMCLVLNIHIEKKTVMPFQRNVLKSSYNKKMFIEKNNC